MAACEMVPFGFTGDASAAYTVPNNEIHSPAAAHSRGAQNTENMWLITHSPPLLRAELQEQAELLLRND